LEGDVGADARRVGAVDMRIQGARGPNDELMT
jgi:hypothetical protein